MTLKHYFLFATALAIYSCKQPQQFLTKVEGTEINISDSIYADPRIEAYIKPYRKHIATYLDSVLAYSKETYTKFDGEYNTALGNFMADALYEQANPVFLKRTGKNIDMAILNYGGMRAIISKGNITIKNAFELMPFENSIVVVAIKGNQIDDIISYLLKSKKANPISKLKLKIDKNFNVIEKTINGETIDANRIYYIATNDYLYNGGDYMTFFKPNEGLYKLDYKIRNALIDYFTKIDTLKPVIDDRFIQIK